MDNVRMLKSKITEKCTQIRTINFGHNNRQIKQSENYCRVGANLADLKKGAEILER